MSEYQWYEFLAIDRPLTAVEMDELRTLSTRATITPVSFSNDYHWGDFKGNPDTLMEYYFDAHVYVANWMTAVFMVRLPMEALTREVAELMAVPGTMDIRAAEPHWIISWSLEESDDDDRFAMDDGRDWMARLAPVRDELLRGDLRSLYIGWLADVSRDWLDDDETEPLAVRGLGSLTAAQQALAEFLAVDADLLVGAGMGRPAAQETSVSPRDVDAWIANLPRRDVDALLRQILEGNGHQAERSIRNRFASWQRGLQTGDDDAHLRTVAALWQNADQARLVRLDEEERDRARREIERREQREAFLKRLFDDVVEAWAAVREPVERGSGRGYDEACRMLVDIADAYDSFSTRQQFQRELKTFMADHLRREALIRRLKKAGIWKDG